MKVIAIFAAVLAVAMGAQTSWTVNEVSAALQDPSTNPALIPFLEHALNEMMDAIYAGYPPEAVQVAVPAVSTWTLQELNSALENPATNPALVPYLEQALNDIMQALESGQQMDTIAVVVPAAIAPVEAEIPVLPVAVPNPVQVPNPAPVPSPPPTASSPLVQIIVNVGKPQQLSDLNCIGRNLAGNSRCNPNVVGRIPERYTVDQYRFDAPYFNATYIDSNLVISNSNKCRVSEFYINLSSDNVVLAVNCPMLDFASNRTLIQHTSLVEDRSYSYKIQGTYPLIRLTTTLHYKNGLDLCSAFTFADVAALPLFRIDPNNPQTAKFLSRDLTLLNIFERECFFWRAPLLARFFINSLICDFGCNY
ncbi:unnamed protein product, partial [Iphiclides podalirius]